MYVKYGDYQHPSGEVNLQRFDVHARYSPRGLRYSTVFRAHTEGVLAASSQGAIHTRVTELVQAYATDGYDWGLFHDDGTPTQYRLIDNHPAAMSGVRVLERSWPRGGPTEYATQRTFSVTLESELGDQDPRFNSGVIDWHEDLEFVGNTGRDFETVTLPVGAPVQFVTAEQTPMWVIQSGWSIGLLGYVEPFGPLWSDYEKKKLRRYKRSTPKFYGRIDAFYKVSWAYFMELPFYAEGSPTIR